MPRYGNEANFSCFFHFLNFEVKYLPEWAKPCGFIRGIHALLFNVTEKFHLAQSMLM